jgi:hypothetical protein
MFSPSITCTRVDCDCRLDIKFYIVETPRHLLWLAVPVIGVIFNVNMYFLRYATADGWLWASLILCAISTAQYVRFTSIKRMYRIASDVSK